MATKSLVFLAICLAVAVSQSGAARNNNNNNDNNGDDDDNNNNNNNNNNNRNGNMNGNSNNNRNMDGNSNNNNNRNSNGNSNNNGNSNGNSNNNGNRVCKSLVQDSKSRLVINCVNQNGDSVSCTERIASGTKAMLKCKKNYVVREETMIPDMTCQSGVWNRPLSAFKCMEVPIATGYNYSVGLGFYKFYPQQKRWDEAKKICENDGGHLIVISSAEEMDAANSSMSSIQIKVPKVGGKGKNSTKSYKSSSDDINTVFVGATNNNPDGTWMSVTNLPVTNSLCEVPTSLTKKKTGKLCAALKPGQLCYVEISCLFKRSFICEIEPPKAEAESSSSSSKV